MDRTSCTLFKAVFRNPCVLALHPVHTVRPPTGCPVPPGAPSARPAWIKLWGLCSFMLASGPAARRMACGGRTPAGRAAQNDEPSTSEVRSRRGGYHAPFSLTLNSERSLFSRRERTSSPCTSTSPRTGAPPPLARLGAPAPLAELGAPAPLAGLGAPPTASPVGAAGNPGCCESCGPEISVSAYSQNKTKTDLLCV